ncbi:MAG TPA: ABC transporter permease, partial [Protaetiibacter sp.]|nr:ABC transporter permease [Protaetiibacter sp.]
VIGVFTIQTLDSTILFLGVPPAVAPLFLAIAVVIVVLIQSPPLREAVTRGIRAMQSKKAEVAR